MERGTDKTRKPHHGRNVTRLRELRQMKQETLASLLGLTQQAVSKIEQSETIDEGRLEEIAKILDLPIEALKDYNEELVINLIQNNYEGSKTSNTPYYQYNNQCTFNVLDKYVEAVEKIEKLYEALLQSEREKVALLERLMDKR